jgi:hypothetical protein
VTAPAESSGAFDIARDVSSGARSALSVVENAFARADAVGAGRDGLNITLYEDRGASMDEARRVDSARTSGEDSFRRREATTHGMGINVTA